MTTTGSVTMDPGLAVRARRHVTGASVSLLAAVAWAVLAWRTPTSTHHFAPLVIGGAWPYVLRQDLRHRTGADRAIAAVGGLLFALVTFIGLLQADRLSGPPLLAAVPVRAELPIMALLGVVIGTGFRRNAAATAADHPSP